MTGNGRRLLVPIYCLLFLLPAPGFARRQEKSPLELSLVANIPALIRESKEKSDQNWEVMIRRYADYTLKRRRVLRKTNTKGEVKEESELYEIYIPAQCKQLQGCNTVQILLEKDGKPVSPEKIGKDRLNAGKKLDKADRETYDLPQSPDRASGKPNWMRFNVRYHHTIGRHRYVNLDGQEILEKCEFFSPQRERIGDRDTIALSFRPRFGATFSVGTRYMSEVEGKIWIDALDKVIVRLAAWPSGERNHDLSSDDLLKMAALSCALVRTKEGIWFFRLGQINADKYPKLFGEKVGFSVEQFDYVSFRVEVEKGEVVPPTKQP